MLCSSSTLTVGRMMREASRQLPYNLKLGVCFNSQETHAACTAIAFELLRKSTMVSSLSRFPEVGSKQLLATTHGPVLPCFRPRARSAASDTPAVTAASAALQTITEAQTPSLQPCSQELRIECSSGCAAVDTQPDFASLACSWRQQGFLAGCASTP